MVASGYVVPHAHAPHRSSAQVLALVMAAMRKTWMRVSRRRVPHQGVPPPEAQSRKASSLAVLRLDGALVLPPPKTKTMSLRLAQARRRMTTKSLLL